MRKMALAAAACTVAALAALPTGTAMADTCLATTGDGTQVACYYADAGCVVGSLKGNQYLRPCVQADLIRP